MNVSKKRLITTIILDIAVFGILLLLVSMQACEPVARMLGVSADETAGVLLATPFVTEASTAPPVQTPEATPEADVTADPAATEEPTAEPTLTPDPVPGLCGSRFPDKFTTGEVVSDETTYKSQNIDISVTLIEENDVRYQIADIYLQDITCLQSYGTWMDDVKNAHPPELGQEAGAILAVNGDYYVNAKFNEQGWFVRNGTELARFDYMTYANDLCILYYDGTMETVNILDTPTLDFDGVLAKYPYQIWYFGPSLLTADGQVPESYNSTLMTFNPRTAIGYYEPGHYCLVTVEGTRGSKKASKGMTMQEMSALFASLGCKAAYNLDGGGSAAMYFNGVSFGNNDRTTSDIVMIKDILGGGNA